MPELPLAKLFVLLFMMTGPLRVVPTFYSLSREMDSASLLRVARRAALFAAAGVLLAVFCGHSVLSSWGASPQALGHRDWIAPFAYGLAGVDWLASFSRVAKANRHHLLGDLIVICIMAVIAGADGPLAIGK